MGVSAVLHRVWRRPRQFVLDAQVSGNFCHGTPLAYNAGVTKTRLYNNIIENHYFPPSVTSVYSLNITNSRWSFVPQRRFNLAYELCPIFLLPWCPKYKCTLALRMFISGASSELCGGHCNKIKPLDSNSCGLWRKSDLTINCAVLLTSARNESIKDSFWLVIFGFGEQKKWNTLCITT